MEKHSRSEGGNELEEYRQAAAPAAAGRTPAFRGLTDEEVRVRAAGGKVNVTEDKSSRTVKEIVLSNIFTLFNLINVILFALVLLVFSPKNGTFMVVVIVNTVVGIVQELRAKKALDDLRVLTQSEADVVRNGRTVKLPVTQLVQDDVVILASGMQVPADAVVLAGALEVNESLLTGESDNIGKSAGAKLLSGSFVTSGKAYVRVTQVGDDCYAAQLSKEAKAFKKSRSALKEDINRILKTIGFLLIPVGLLMFAKLYYLTGAGFRSAVLDSVAAVVGMIPEGLVFLTSVALVLGVLRLTRKRTLVQELYGIEMLARVDTLCLDKTGTITEGSLKLERVLSLAPDRVIPEELETLLAALPDANATITALRESYSVNAAESVPGVTDVLPFSSSRKYSGVRIGGTCWYLGAYDFLFRTDEQTPAVGDRVHHLAAEGYRVLMLAHGPGELARESRPAGLVPDAVFLLSDVVRDNAADTLSYFAAQDVNVMIISGDDPATVQAVAGKAGLTGLKAVDASQLTTDDALREALRTARIFGRVSPAQKEKMVGFLQEDGHTVAMTGDGVNDVLALKKADCSIAMGNGSDAAKNIAGVVLLDSDFSAMPEIVNEGRRVINNIRRAASLFLIKTTFSTILGIMTILIGRSYPFEPIQLSLISAFGVGIPSFLLQLEPSFERADTPFLSEVLKHAVPAAFTITTLVFLVQNIGMLAGCTDQELATICVLTTAFNYVLAQLRVYQPVTRYRGLVVYSSMFAFLASIVLVGRWLLDLTDLRLELVAVVCLAVQISGAVQSLYRRLYSWLIEKFNAWREARRLKKSAQEG